MYLWNSLLLGVVQPCCLVCERISGCNSIINGSGIFEYPKRRRYIFESYLQHGPNKWTSPSMTYQMPSNSIHSRMD